APLHSPTAARQGGRDAPLPRRRARALALGIAAAPGAAVLGDPRVVRPVPRARRRLTGGSLPPERRLRSVKLDPRLLVIGLGGGLLSGLLGVGGGIVMVPLLVLWARYSQRAAHAMSLGAIIPISVAGIAIYGSAGEVRYWQALGL